MFEIKGMDFKPFFCMVMMMPFKFIQSTKKPENIQSHDGKNYSGIFFTHYCDNGWRRLVIFWIFKVSVFKEKKYQASPFNNLFKNYQASQ
jgi:hypothetical protein